MASPVVPADFAAAVPSASDTPCDAFTKLITMASLVSQWATYQMKADGSLTDEFVDDLGVSAAGLSAPSSVVATEDRADDVTISWTGVAGATTYAVYRGSSPDTTQMGDPIATGLSASPYVDSSAVAGTVYWYSVQARSNRGLSALSAADEGKRTTTSGSGGSTVDDDITNITATSRYKTVTVPAGVDRLTLRVWGAGGAGGYYKADWAPLGSGPGQGGGGASGSFVRVDDIEVSPGDKWYVVIGLRSSNDGQTFVFKDSLGSDNYVYATPGNDGALNSGTATAAGGSVASSYGGVEGTIAGATVNTDGSVGSRVGNAGTASGSGDGSGGAAVSRAGFASGGGGDGVRNLSVFRKYYAPTPPATVGSTEDIPAETQDMGESGRALFTFSHS